MAHSPISHPKHIWNPKNCTILHWDSSSYTWIPEIWVSHSPHLEHLRIQFAQREFHNSYELYQAQQIQLESLINARKKRTKQNIYRFIKTYFWFTRTSK